MADYVTEVAADNPLMWWKLDESSGTVATDSGANYDVTTTNGALLAQAGVRPGVTYAAEFDGVNDYLNRGDMAFVVATPWTMEAWADIETTSRRGPFLKLGTNVNGFALGVGNGTLDALGNELVAVFENVTWRASGVMLGTGVKYVAVTVDTSNVCRFYIDGVKVSTLAPASAPIRPESSDPIYIGGYTAGVSRYFAGRLNDVAFYQSVLSDARIEAHYLAATARTTRPRLRGGQTMVGELRGGQRWV